MAIGAYLLLMLLPGSTVFGFEVSEHPNFHLVNGENCGQMKDPFGKFSWIAFISIERENLVDGITQTLQCAGTVLNENYIITAGNCIADHNMTRVASAKVYLASCSSAEDAYESESIIFHPHYDITYKYGFNVGLIRVNRPMEFNELVVPICLEYGNLQRESYGGQHVEAFSFGSFTFGDDASCPNTLQSSTIKILSRKDCLDTVVQSALPTIVKTLVCVGGVPAQFNYVGDPLMVVKRVTSEPSSRFYHIGIVSYSESQSEDGTLILFDPPSGYTRVSHILRWILDHLEP